MKSKSKIFYIGLIVLLIFTCSVSPKSHLPEKTIETNPEPNPNEEGIETSKIDTLKILALGDSYTIGQSICDTCRFPEQLKNRIELELDSLTQIQLKVIAKTGWTTSNLINAINNDNLSSDYNLVTLLIGVNNQFQSQPFSIYEIEFPLLVNKAIAMAKFKKSNVIVVSIPDYAFTPFGKHNTNISEGIDRYNTFAENFCSINNISFVYITDITRQGIINPLLVASDGLHPSEFAYSKFVDKILPLALKKLKK